MMNPGELNERIKILTLSAADNIYQWSAAAFTWAKAEPYFKQKLLAAGRHETKQVRFIIRKCEISLDNAILWNDEYCFLSSIVELDRMYYEVTAIMTEPKTCTVAKTDVSLDSLSRPVTSPVANITFPGCLTNLPSKRSEVKPGSLLEQRYLLTVPKGIGMEAGEIVAIEDVDYEVWIPRLSSGHENQYEIRVRRDA